MLIARRGPLGAVFQRELGEPPRNLRLRQGPTCISCSNVVIAREGCAYVRCEPIGGGFASPLHPQCSRCRSWQQSRYDTVSVPARPHPIHHHALWCTTRLAYISDEAEPDDAALICLWCHLRGCPECGQFHTWPCPYTWPERPGTQQSSREWPRGRSLCEPCASPPITTLEPWPTRRRDPPLAAAGSLTPLVAATTAPSP